MQAQAGFTSCRTFRVKETFGGPLIQTLPSKDKKKKKDFEGNRTRTKVSLHLDFLSRPLLEQAQISMGPKNTTRG